MLNERIKRLRDKSLSAEPELFAERAVLITTAYQNNRLVSPPLKRAMALKHLLENITIVIDADELIVGEKTEKYRGSPLYPEQYCMSLEELSSLEEREFAPFKVSEVVKRELCDRVIPFWRGRTMCDLIMGEMEDEWKLALDNDVFTEYMISRAPGHVNLDEKVLSKGLNGLKQDITATLSTVDTTAADCYCRIQQLKAMGMAVDAAMIFADRYAQKAAELAQNETDPLRRDELHQIAAVCRRVPRHPAETFHEALQSYWFIHLVSLLEVNNWAIGPGRFDLYMYPFFRKDLDEGRITPEQAQELLQSLWIKFNNAVAPAKESKTAAMSATYNDFALLNLGGLDADGADAANPLSHMVLDVIREMRFIQPNPCVQISRKTSEKFIRKTMTVIREGLGQPSLFNADLVVKELLNKGKSLLDARLGGPNGCVTVNACGKENMASTGYCNWAKILEITLNNGRNPVTGQLVGLKVKAARAFIDFEDLFAAFKKQLEYFVGLKMRANNLIDMIYAEHMPVPFLSVLVDDCIAKGKDFHGGGARYNMSYIQGVGLGTLTDSLAAIQKAVFNEKCISLPELVEVLAENFEGHERLRQYLQNRAPKYGNNDPEADSIMRRVVDTYLEIVDDRPTSRGGRYGVNLLPTTVHVAFGLASGATPDGRKAGQPFSDGISPAHGADRTGPTAVVLSAAKIGQERLCGTLLNQKFSPQALQRPEDLEKLADLLKTYFKLNGHHLQFNVIDTKTLRKAKADPDSYRNLIVRVAGYSDYFVNLSHTLQDEIIARTEHRGL